MKELELFSCLKQSHLPGAMFFLSINVFDMTFHSHPQRQAEKSRLEALYLSEFITKTIQATHSFSLLESIRQGIKFVKARERTRRNHVQKRNLCIRLETCLHPPNSSLTSYLVERSLAQFSLAHTLTKIGNTITNSLMRNRILWNFHWKRYKWIPRKVDGKGEEGQLCLPVADGEEKDWITARNIWLRFKYTIA